MVRTAQMVPQREQPTGKPRERSGPMSQDGGSRVTLVSEELVSRRRSPMSDWFPPESLSPSNDPFHLQDDLGPDERPVRKGLPPSYQMRHDRHFVDELDSRSPAALIRMVPTRDIESPDAVDLVEVAPLVESVRKVGVLQPFS